MPTRRPKPRVVTGKWTRLRDSFMRRLSLLPFERRHRAALNRGDFNPAPRRKRGVEQETSQRVDEMSFELVADATAPVRQVGEAKTLQRIAGGGIQRDLDLLRAPDAGEDVSQHGLEDFETNVGADEVEHDDVLANAIEDFRAAELQLEVALDFLADARADCF